MEGVKKFKCFREVAKYVETRSSKTCYFKVKKLIRDGVINDMCWENRLGNTRLKEEAELV